MVTFFELELPAFTAAKLKLVGLSESATEPAVPVPLRVTTAGDPGALLAILTLPFKLPVVVGAKSTLNVAAPPGAIVTGAVMIRAEERELLTRFGEEYRAYQRRVPAIVPKV